MHFSLLNLLLGASVWSCTLVANALPLDNKGSFPRSAPHYRLETNGPLADLFGRSEGLFARTAPPLPPGAERLDVDKLETQFRARFEMQLKVKLDHTANFVFHTAIRDTGDITNLIGTFKAQHLSPKNAFQVGNSFQKTWKDKTFPAYDKSKPSQGWRWWAAVSVAYSKMVSGTVYLIIPKGRPLNKSRIDGGSHWWSYELPIITAPGGDATKIMRVDYDSQKKSFSEPKMIWKKGDTQIGTLQDINTEPAKSTSPDVWGPEALKPSPKVPRPPIRSMLDV